MARTDISAGGALLGKRAWLLFAFGCFLAWGLFGFLAKIVSTSLGPAETQVLFTLGMTPFAVAVLARGGAKLLIADRRGAVYGLMNGVLSGIGTLLMFGAFSLGPASIVGPVTGAFPLVTVVMAWVFLKERITAVQMLGLAAAMAGLTLVAIP